MDYFKPVDIALLVYGYMIDEGYPDIANQFLERCPYIKSNVDLVNKGIKIRTKILGKTLINILDMLADVTRLVLSYDNEPSEEKSLANLLSRLNDIVSTKDVPMPKRSIYIRISLPDCICENELSREDKIIKEFVEHFKNNTTLHEKLAENINKAADTGSVNNEEVIKTAVSTTEADPFFNELVQELFGPSTKSVECQVNECLDNFEPPPEVEPYKEVNQQSTSEAQFISPITIDQPKQPVPLHVPYVPMIEPLKRTIHPADNTISLVTSSAIFKPCAIYSNYNLRRAPRPVHFPAIAPKPPVDTSSEAVPMPTVEKISNPKKPVTIRTIGARTRGGKRGRGVKTINSTATIKILGPVDPPTPSTLQIGQPTQPTEIIDLSKDVEILDIPQIVAQEIEIISTEEKNDMIKETSTEKPVEQNEVSEPDPQASESRDNVTPCQPPLPKKLCLSTPRKKSHIRALDFETPPRDPPTRKANTSPKSIQESRLPEILDSLHKVKKQALNFDSPPKKKAWDADLRIYSNVDVIPTYVGLKRNKLNNKRKLKPKKLNTVPEENSQSNMVTSTPNILEKSFDSPGKALEAVLIKECSRIENLNETPKKQSENDFTPTDILVEDTLRNNIMTPCTKSALDALKDDIMTPCTKILAEETIKTNLLTPGLPPTPRCDKKDLNSSKESNKSRSSDDSKSSDKKTNKISKNPMLDLINKDLNEIVNECLQEAVKKIETKKKVKKKPNKGNEESNLKVKQMLEMLEKGQLNESSPDTVVNESGDNESESSFNLCLNKDDILGSSPNSSPKVKEDGELTIWSGNKERVGKLSRSEFIDIFEIEPKNEENLRKRNRSPDRGNDKSDRDLKWKRSSRDNRHYRSPWRDRFREDKYRNYRQERRWDRSERRPQRTDRRRRDSPYRKRSDPKKSRNSERSERNDREEGELSDTSCSAEYLSKIPPTLHQKLCSMGQKGLENFLSYVHRDGEKS